MSDIDVRSDQAPWQERLRSAADLVEQHEEALELAREQRDQLVVEACEAGYKTRHVGRWARISQSRVSGILAQH